MSDTFRQPKWLFKDKTLLVGPMKKKPLSGEEVRVRNTKPVPTRVEGRNHLPDNLGSDHLVVQSVVQTY